MREKRSFTRLTLRKSGSSLFETKGKKVARFFTANRTVANEITTQNLDTVSSMTTLQTATTASTRRELADAMGLRDESRISRYAAAGMPVNDDGTYQVNACISWREANVRKKKDHDKLLLRWKAKHEREKAKIARIKRLQLENQMMELSAVWQLVSPVSEAVGKLADATLNQMKESESEVDPAILALIVDAVGSLNLIQTELTTRIERNQNVC